MKIIADGDSWFDYPKILLTDGGLVDHLQSLIGLPITNYAHASDATIETMGLEKSKRLESILPGADILLFSGGGDDIAGDQFCIWLNQNTDGDVNKAINWTRLNAVLDLIIADYEDLSDIRDRLAPNCWIVTHSYDFPVASMLGKGVLWLGPWLKPGLEYCGWMNPNDQVLIIQMILREFHHRLSLFAAQNLRHIHVNTQGTLAPEDWDNEIHANGGGWQKLAQVVNLAILPLFDKISSPAPQPAIPAPTTPVATTFISEAAKVAAYAAEALKPQNPPTA
jgi:hypothetical protein